MSTSSPENPQSNGHAESGVRIAKSIMKKSANMSDYRKNMAIYRNTPTGDGGSPSELMFNRKWKSHLPELPKYSSNNSSNNTLVVGMKIRVYIDGKFENVGTIVETRNSGQSYVIRLNDGRTFVRNKKFLRKYHGNGKSRKAP